MIPTDSTQSTKISIALQMQDGTIKRLQALTTELGLKLNSALIPVPKAVEGNKPPAEVNGRSQLCLHIEENTNNLRRLAESLEEILVNLEI